MKQDALLFRVDQCLVLVGSKTPSWAVETRVGEQSVRDPSPLTLLPNFVFNELALLIMGSSVEVTVGLHLCAGKYEQKDLNRSHRVKLTLHKLFLFFKKCFNSNGVKWLHLLMIMTVFHRLYSGHVFSHLSGVENIVNRALNLVFTSPQRQYRMVDRTDIPLTYEDNYHSSIKIYVIYITHIVVVNNCAYGLLIYQIYIQRLQQQRLCGVLVGISHE